LQNLFLICAIYTYQWRMPTRWVNRPYQAFFENFDRQLPEIFL
jgi:hypothetical protein